MNKKANLNKKIKDVNRRLAQATSPRCIKSKAPQNPPAVLNAGDCWHVRKVALTSLADTGGTANLLAGPMLLALSGNAANVPIRVSKISAWAISGTAGTYPPTFLQVNFRNEEFCQSFTNSPAVRDSITDAGGQGSGPPCISLSVPEALQLIRADWGTGATAVLAEAVGLPSGGRVLWHVTLCFKF